MRKGYVVRKFLIGLLCGFFFAALALVVLAFAAIRLGDRTPSVPPKGALVMKLDGDMPERAPVALPIPWFQSQAPPTMLEMWNLLRRAETDDRIQALVLDIKDLDFGWARLQELRDSVVRFKKSGKPVLAYLRHPRAREYYLATAADQIFFTREDLLDLKGMRAEITYYRRTLDKLGVQLEIEHAGKYKDAGDMFTRTNMSPETREVLNSMLDILFGNLVDTIAKGRNRPPDEIRALIDNGPFLAPKAVEAHLIDELIYEEEVFDRLTTRLRVKDLKRISHRDYLRAIGSGRDQSGTTIAVVVGEGAISRGGSIQPFSDEEGIRSGPFTRLLKDVGEDKSVRAVILRINSPGGDAIASDEILHGVRLLSKKKPTVISMSDLAASGGYYMAMSGDPVVAYGNTITGSIGVIYGKANLKGLYDKLGMDTDVITRGRFAEIDASYKPMTETERQKLREGIDFVYSSFLSRVSEGRRRSVDQIKPLAEGRAWLGSQAKVNGLVDEIGGLDRAIELLRERAKIGKDEKVRFLLYPPKRSLIEQLMRSSEDNSVEAAVSQRARRLLRAAGMPDLDLGMWSRSGYFRIAPYQINFH